MEDINLNNMATTPALNILLERMIPPSFNKGDDLEEFITACKKIFDVLKLSERDREIYAATLIHYGLEKEYSATNGKVKGFDARLRLAFSKPRTLLQEWEEALRYRKGEDSAEVFISKIENFVGKILEYKIDKEELTKQFLIHCTDTREMKKEILRQKAKNTEEIKETIRIVDRIEAETEKVNVIRSYRDAVRGKGFDRNKQTMGRERRFVAFKQEESVQQMECWSCHKNGHLSRNCPNRREIKCYACGVEGHIRRNCLKVQCKRCGRNGHRAEECFSRRRQFDGKTGTQRVIHEGDPFGKRREGEGRLRFVNAVENHNENQERRTETIDNDVWYDRKYKDIIDYEYPKDRAPSEVEMIGAMI